MGFAFCYGFNHPTSRRGDEAVIRAVLQEQQTSLVRSEDDLRFNHLLEVMPAAAYTCDAEGLITGFNERAVEAWGRKPRLNDPLDRY